MKQAFKCTNNEAVTAAHEEFQRKADEFHTATDALAAEFGAEAYCRQYGYGSRWMPGITLPEGQPFENKLWRKDDDYYIHGRDFYVPNRRSTAGRELYQRLKALSTDGYQLPGMPRDVLIEEKHLFTSPGSNFVGGQWYSSFAHKLPDKAVEEIVGSGFWEVMRPSALMAIYEDEDARLEAEPKM